MSDTFHPVFRIVLVVLLISGQLVGPVAAADNSTEEGDDEEETIVNVDIDISSIVDSIKNLTDEFGEFQKNWTVDLQNVLKAVLFDPFRTLLQQLLNFAAIALSNTPNVYPNPPVEEIHQQTLVVAYLLSGLTVVLTGILYIVGPVFGFSYRQVSKILPRVGVALVFSTVSLQLLQLTIDATDALVMAFRPTDLTATMMETSGVGVALVLVWVINSSLLLVVIALYIFRGVFILFVASISPLLALAWAFTPARKYAEPFISGYWSALAMAPLNLLALRLTFSLMEGSGATSLQILSNWIFGIAGFSLLLWIPYELHGASQSAVAQAYVISRGLRNRTRQYIQKKRRQERHEERLKAMQKEDRGDGRGSDHHRRRRDR